jgi:hypothetical protein
MFDPISAPGTLAPADLEAALAPYLDWAGVESGYPAVRAEIAATTSLLLLRAGHASRTTSGAAVQVERPNHPVAGVKGSGTMSSFSPGGRRRPGRSSR